MAATDPPVNLPWPGFPKPPREAREPWNAPDKPAVIPESQLTIRESVVRHSIQKALEKVYKDLVVVNQNWQPVTPEELADSLLPHLRGSLY